MAGLMAEPESINLDSLRITGPGNLDLRLSGHLIHGQGNYSFSLDGIALTRAEKLRLISSGDVELVSDSSVCFLIPYGSNCPPAILPQVAG